MHLARTKINYQEKFFKQIDMLRNVYKRGALISEQFEEERFFACST